MRPRGSLIRRMLQVGAAFGLLLAAAAGFTGVEAQKPVAVARIDSPADGTQVEGVVEIRGQATVQDGGQFAFYRLLIGAGRSPGEQRPLGPPGEKPVENGLLGTWD